MKKYINIVFLLFFGIILTGCGNKEDSKNEKIKTEIDYLATEIFSLSNSLNNIPSNIELLPKEVEIKNEESNSEENKQDEGNSEKEEEPIQSVELSNASVLNSELKIDWEKAKIDIEQINSIWSIINIDLKNAKVADNDLQEFNDTLNLTIISIKNEEQINAIDNICKLYSFIPTFYEYMSVDAQSKVSARAKNELLKACNSVNKNEWESVDQYIINAENEYLELNNQNTGSNNKNFNVEKIQTLVKNLRNTTTLKDKELFFMHYKIIIENI